MKLVVTGARGGLGGAFVAAVAAHHQVHAFDHEGLDIGDHDAVRQIVEPLAPDAIVNCAAFTQVDGNETDPARAARDNAMGPQHLALVARGGGAALLHISTDYVFDGTKGAPYDELDEPAPISVYGRAKLAGERHVAAICPDHLIVRVGYVYGGGADYLTHAMRALADGREAGGLTDRVGTPTYVGDVAERLLPLLLTRRWGTYHLASPEPATWFEVLSRAKALTGLPGGVRPQTADELGLPAPRPAYSALTSLYLPHMDGITPVPGLDAGLSAFVATLDALP
ncbi:MAG: NAD(P)-dependent oxidoreductase [Actinomycetota bacterium]